MSLENEQQLVQAVQRNKDQQAFTTLYNHYFPRLYAYISYRVGRVPDSEDLVAETFLHAIEALNDFEWQHQASFAAWIFRIAHNLVSDWYKRKQNSNYLVPLPLDDLPEIVANELLPDEIFLRKEQFNYLYQQLANIAPRRQEVIMLKFFGGLRNQEIARVLNLDERTVAVHLRRGLLDLSRRFENRQTNREELHQKENQK